MMYAVADGDAAATRWHTKGEAVTNGTQKARRRRTVRWQRMAISKQTTINRTLRSHHDVCGRRWRRGGDLVAHKRRGGDEWYTKGEAAANGEVAVNGDLPENCGQTTINQTLRSRHDVCGRCESISLE